MAVADVAWNSRLVEQTGGGERRSAAGPGAWLPAVTTRGEDGYERGTEGADVSRVVPSLKAQECKE